MLSALPHSPVSSSPDTDRTWHGPLARFTYVMRDDSPFDFPKVVTTDAQNTGPSWEPRFIAVGPDLAEATRLGHQRSQRYGGQAQGLLQASDGVYYITNLGKPVPTGGWYAQRIDGPVIDRWYESVTVSSLHPAMRAVLGLEKVIPLAGSWTT